VLPVTLVPSERGCQGQSTAVNAWSVLKGYKGQEHHHGWWWCSCRFPLQRAAASRLCLWQTKWSAGVGEGAAEASLACHLCQCCVVAPVGVSGVKGGGAWQCVQLQAQLSRTHCLLAVPASSVSPLVDRGTGLGSVTCCVRAAYSRGRAAASCVCSCCDEGAIRTACGAPTATYTAPLPISNCCRPAPAVGRSCWSCCRQHNT
jgi:hypothetical protein